MDQDKINIMYDEKGTAIRVQMDFDQYKWMLDHIPQSDRQMAAVR